MDERSKVIFTIMGGAAMLFFLVTNFCLPISRRNAKLAKEYKELRKEEEAITKFDQEELDSLLSRVDTAISGLETKFPPEGKLKLVEQLTQTPAGSKIVFAQITHKPTLERRGYRISPVEVNMKTTFYDLIRYLSGIETNSLLIGIDNLNLRNFDPQTKTLDIQVTFLGYRLTQEFAAISKYMEDRYKPFDELRIAKLLEPVKEIPAEDAVSELWGYNPFTSSLDSKRPPKPSIISAKEAATEIDTLSLKGILRVGEEKTALINDSVVKEGEKIAGMEVVEIRDHRVILQRSGKKYILKMGVDDDFIKP